MAKSWSSAPPLIQDHENRSPLARRCIKLAAASSALLLWALAARLTTDKSPLWSSVLDTTFARTPATQPGFRWDYVAPSTSLQYTPCFADYQCARLSVPINWNATADEQERGPRAEVAIIKLPAQVPVTDPRYGGPILLNPGGPGESGVHQVLSDGKSLQMLVDAPESTEEAGGKYFDIVSFDPRGVNNTTPRLRCFPDASSQQAWLLQLSDYGILWDSEHVVGIEWARAETIGKSCSHGEDEGGMLRYANTAQVAEDMLQIVEKEAEWREAEAERLIRFDESTNAKTRELIRERTAHKAGRENIKYWGSSYGTVLGATFAALHPDRIERMILDGVVDPADHYAAQWRAQLQDSDQIITKFCEYCFEAGREGCPLYTGSSAKDVEARFTSIARSLKKVPIAVPLLDGNMAFPEIVSYGDVHLNLLTGMYFSFAFAEGLFDLLLAVEARNASSPALTDIAARKQARQQPAQCGPGEAKGGGECIIPYISGLGPSQAISCMDASGAETLTREGFSEYLQELQGQSRWISTSWARNKLACVGHSLKPAWKPDWTFETQQWQNTSYPLLIIGNSHDTVTPLRNARRVSTLFPGSTVLQQDSEGHCSHSNPSLCTARAIRVYFQTGSLPAEGTVCSPEARPFLGCKGSSHTQGTSCDFADSENARLWEALVDLADPFGLRK